jgi:hypothetical protein
MLAAHTRPTHGTLGISGTELHSLIRSNLDTLAWPFSLVDHVLHIGQAAVSKAHHLGALESATSKFIL